MTQSAKLWGSGSAATDDITDTSCCITTSYPTILTPAEGHLIKSVTVAPAGMKTVTLTATATDSTHITFSSSGSDLLGTKILSYYIYSSNTQLPQSGNNNPKVILFACGMAAGNSYLVSSSNPASLNRTNTGQYMAWGNSSGGNTCYYYFSKFADTWDYLNLSYTGADGNLTITIDYDTYGNSGSGVWDLAYAYTGVFQVVNEA